MIKVTFKDGKIREFKKGITGLEIAKTISSSLKKESICILVNNELFDLLTPIQVNSKIDFIIDKTNEKALSVLRHSCAHILAMAVLNLYPNAKLSIGPSTNEGFYYDFDFVKNKIGEKELVKIENEMRRILKTSHNFKRNIISKSNLEKKFKSNKFKLSYIKEAKGELLLYEVASFSDFCKGPHLVNTNKIKHFKLTHLSGSYFKGDAKNKMLTRIYGTAFFSQEELKEFLKMLDERKNRDHRKIGKEMNIFMFDKRAGQGFPFFLDNGIRLKNNIKKVIRDIELKNDYIEIETPIFGSSELYQTSGHLDHYSENIFPKIKLENDTYYLRPMSCPHHCIVFNQGIKSYKDLPIRLTENARMFRYEKSGALIGIERTRAMELTDSHIFVRPDQIELEIQNIFKIIKKTLSIFGIKIFYIELALRDKNDKVKYHGSNKIWADAEFQLEKVLKVMNIEYKKLEGEAAFYGPKIDIQIKTALGHIVTMSTIQLDFFLPKKFKTIYKNKNGKDEYAVLIHRGLIGTYERFISILLEQTKGIFPLWLSPKQIVIIPLSNSAHFKKAKEIKERLYKEGIEYISIDSREERIGYKIRDHQTNKVNFQIVVGDKEMKKDTITFRKYGDKNEKELSLQKFIELLKKEMNY